MEFTERYVNTFFTNLSKDKLIGQKCNKCGTYRLFPVPVCSECQSTDLSYVELSPEGELLYLSVTTMPAPRFAKYAPYCSGCIKLKDGPVFWTMVEGINIKDPEGEFAKLPLKVDITFKDVAGNRIPVAKVRE